MVQIKVLIADDHEILRFGISTFLSTIEEIEVVGEASSGEECIRLFQQTSADVCILDISMPHKDGIETTRALREIDPEVKILILSMHTDEQILEKILKEGINGYLLKSTDKSNLVNGIKAVANGQQVFSDVISRIMTNSYIRKKNASGSVPDGRITRREREVLQLIVQGLTSQDIAQKLFISPRTVDTHRTNLMQKLKLKNTADLVRFALEKKLVANTRE